MLKNLSVERKKDIPEREGVKVKSLDVKKKMPLVLRLLPCQGSC